MKIFDRHTVLVLMTIAVLLIQLVYPTTAFADGESPATPTETTVTTTPEPTGTIPPGTDTPTPDLETSTPQPTETTPPVTDSPTPEPPTTDLSTPTPDASSSPTVVPVETSPSAEEDISTSTLTTSDTAIDPSPTETGVFLDPTTADQATLLETVQTISDTTDVVLLDENGQPIPLASQDAAEIIATGDPVWCPAGQVPTPGINGCTLSYPTLGDLIATEGPGIASNGTIWITSGLVADVNPILIDGRFLSWSQYSLTLQGGWSGISGDTTIGSNSVFSSAPLTIEHWSNDITINNITFKQGSTLEVGHGSGVHNVTGDVTLNSVNITRSPGSTIWTSGDITVNNSSFNNHSYDCTDTNWALNVASPNIVIRNSDFDFSSWGLIVTAWNNVEIIDSSFDNNSIGLWISVVDHSRTTIKNSRFKYNYIGINVACETPATSATLTLNHVNFINNGYKMDFSDCPAGINFTSINEPIDEEPNDTVISANNQAEINLDCSESSIFTILLPNGDRVTLVCPVRGKARISQLDISSLPVDLPEEYTYVSAFDLEIIKDIFNDTLTEVITEGGFIKASFDASSLQPGATYSILYLDKGVWIPLKDFALNENGHPRVFDLNPGIPEDKRKILSGVNLVLKDGTPRVEVSTNFPGIFVLVQR